MSCLKPISSVYFSNFFNLNIFSITDISVEVVSKPIQNIYIIIPQKADQSFTTTPAAIISLPLLIVPAHNGIYNKLANSSNSSTVVKGWTNPP